MTFQKMRKMLTLKKKSEKNRLKDVDQFQTRVKICFACAKIVPSHDRKRKKYF
jgi:hypothetical protein